MLVFKNKKSKVSSSCSINIRFNSSLSQPNSSVNTISLAIYFPLERSDVYYKRLIEDFRLSISKFIEEDLSNTTDNLLFNIYLFYVKLDKEAQSKVILNSQDRSFLTKLEAVHRIFYDTLNQVCIDSYNIRSALIYQVKVQKKFNAIVRDLIDFVHYSTDKIASEGEMVSFVTSSITNLFEEKNVTKKFTCNLPYPFTKKISQIDSSVITETSLFIGMSFAELQTTFTVQKTKKAQQTTKKSLQNNGVIISESAIDSQLSNIEKKAIKRKTLKIEKPTKIKTSKKSKDIEPLAKRKKVIKDKPLIVEKVKKIKSPKSFKRLVKKHLKNTPIEVIVDQEINLENIN